MVCPRCVSAVGRVLDGLHLAFDRVELGEVHLKQDLTPEQQNLLKQELEKEGFEIVDDARRQLIEKVKQFLIQRVQTGLIDEHFVLSEQISMLLHKDYSAVSKLFSQVESMTLEQYFILLRIEKVKECLVYDQYTLSEIAYRLGYSSVAHLSSQFKKTTGLTPSEFRKQHSGLRKPLDQLS